MTTRLSLSFLLLFYLPTLTRATTSLRPLPTISVATFSVGRTWVWEYSQGTAFFSAERYTVVENDGDRVVIEMSTRLAGEADFRVHHRLVVKPKECLAAYANRTLKRAWALEMFYFNQDHWERYEGRGPIPFEEKFNCDPHPRFTPNGHSLTVYKEHGALFQMKRWLTDEPSWFTSEGPDAGVASEKLFPNGVREPYRFRRL